MTVRLSQRGVRRGFAGMISMERVTRHRWCLAFIVALALMLAILCRATPRGGLGDVVGFARAVAAESGSGIGGQQAAMQRIVITLPNGARYSWIYVPQNGAEPARVIAQGRME